jgi:hypothetical protein
MRFTDVQVHQTVVVTNRFYSGQSAPSVESGAIRVSAHGEFHNVMASQAVNQVGRRAFGNDLAVIDDRQPVAKALGFVHVMCGEKNSATVALEAADDVPKLPATLGIEAGGGFIQK